MRVLVTGSDGLIAGELVPLFRKLGHQTETVGRRQRYGPSHHVADLAAPGAADQMLARTSPDVIVHLAGRATGARDALWRDNAVATLNLTSAASALTGRPHLVVVGSAAEYGAGSGGPIAEDADLHPVTEYGRSKMAATRLAESIAVQASMSMSIARPFNIVSPALPGTTALGGFRDQLLAQDGTLRTIRCGRLDVVRDFVSLSFVARSIATIALEAAPGTFNICSGAGLTPGDILRGMAELLNVELVLEPQPDVVAIPAADRVVGDPARLSALGLSETRPAIELARLALGETIAPHR